MSLTLSSLAHKLERFYEGDRPGAIIPEVRESLENRRMARLFWTVRTFLNKYRSMMSKRNNLSFCFYCHLKISVKDGIINDQNWLNFRPFIASIHLLEFYRTSPTQVKTSNI